MIDLKHVLAILILIAAACGLAYFVASNWDVMGTMFGLVFCAAGGGAAIAWAVAYVIDHLENRRR